jgi:hypothetical protein
MAWKSNEFERGHLKPIDLKVGLVCYWQDGGWHGKHIIRKFNKMFVHYSEYFTDEDYHPVYFTKKEAEERSKKEFKTARSKFLCGHTIQKDLCTYKCKGVGEVVEEL